VVVWLISITPWAQEQARRSALERQALDQIQQHGGQLYYDSDGVVGLRNAKQRLGEVAMKLMNPKAPLFRALRAPERF
jgi:hypothetical protein